MHNFRFLHKELRRHNLLPLMTIDKENYVGGYFLCIWVIGTFAIILVILNNYYFVSSDANDGVNREVKT